jgi:hypothetical protein
MHGLQVNGFALSLSGQPFLQPTILWRETLGILLGLWQLKPVCFFTTWAPPQSKAVKRSKEGWWW